MNMELRKLLVKLEKLLPVLLKYVAIGIVVLVVVGTILHFANRESINPVSYTEEIPGTNLSFEMIYVPGGEFDMGSPPEEEGREEDEGPVHRVKVSPFWIGKYEVTWDEFEQYYLGKVDAVTGASPKLNWAWIRLWVQKGLFYLGLPYYEYDAITRPSPFYGAPDHGWGRRKRPAIGMSYLSAQKYCEWISIKTGHRYRLPTEAEWEYAARGGTQDRFYFGGDESRLEEHAWFWDNSDDQTQPVGGLEPNAIGLYDILGNVWEYMGDSYDAAYYAKLAEHNPAVNPTGPDSVGVPVLRGGSWDDDPVDLRIANRLEFQTWWNERDPQQPKGRWWLVDGNMVGMRVVRSAE